MHQSYCTGAAGIEAAKASSAQNLLMAAAAASSSNDSAVKSTSAAPGEGKRVEQKFGKSRLGEGDLKLDDDRLARAMQEERKRKAKGDEEEEGWRSRKRAANGSTIGGSSEVTEEDLGLSFIFSVFGGGLTISQRRTDEIGLRVLKTQCLIIRTLSSMIELICCRSRCIVTLLHLYSTHSIVNIRCPRISRKLRSFLWLTTMN